MIVKTCGAFDSANRTLIYALIPAPFRAAPFTLKLHKLRIVSQLLSLAARETWRFPFNPSFSVPMRNHPLSRLNLHLFSVGRDGSGVHRSSNNNSAIEFDVGLGREREEEQREIHCECKVSPVGRPTISFGAILRYGDHAKILGDWMYSFPRKYLGNVCFLFPVIP